MREGDACGTWLRCSWPLVIALTCGCVATALGQPPRVQFGPIVAVEALKESKKPAPPDKGGGVLLYEMPLTPPSAEQLFRLDAEEVFRQQLRTEVQKRFPKVTLDFPETDRPVAPSPPRDWPAYVMWVEPNYVISKRLLFEQPRFERYGDSLGLLQPAVSIGLFGIDMNLWPARRIVQPLRCYQVNFDDYSPYFQLIGER